MEVFVECELVVMFVVGIELVVVCLGCEVGIGFFEVDVDYVGDCIGVVLC